MPHFHLSSINIAKIQKVKNNKLNISLNKKGQIPNEGGFDAK